MEKQDEGQEVARRDGARPRARARRDGEVEARRAGGQAEVPVVRDVAHHGFE